MAASSSRHPEEQYLDLCREILEHGEDRNTRNGKTRSIFGAKMVYSLEDGVIPFLTTKRLAWRSVIKELLWFLRGDTDARTLQAQGVRIWDGNSTREFLDKTGLHHLEEGDLGPVYGHQWRHFGAEYTTCKTDYTGKGVDQIAEVIRLIREDPTSRRILFSAWNPAQIHLGVLPPCHMMAQFYFSADRKLSCQMYQRSGDVGLGVPFNIASYAVLTYILARLTGTTPGRLIHIIGDSHIYSDHVDALREQVTRTPKPFPHIKIRDDKEFTRVEDFTMEDFEIIGYECHGEIKMKMSA